jgi:hypothetical protein
MRFREMLREVYLDVLSWIIAGPIILWEFFLRMMGFRQNNTVSDSSLTKE